MKHYMNQMSHKTKHALWYVAVCMFGLASLFGGSSVKLQIEWQDAMLVAKSYQVDEVDVRKEHMEDGSSVVDKKGRSLTNAQPKLVSAPFVSYIIWNIGEDIAYISGMIAHIQPNVDHLVVPLGTLAPPIV